MNNRASMTKDDLKGLIPGDWLCFTYGYDRKDWYIIKNMPEAQSVLIGNPRWLVSSAEWFSYESLMNSNPFFLGHTKKKWWTRFFNPELTCPYKRISYF